MSYILPTGQYRLGKDWRPLQRTTLVPSMDPPLPTPSEPQRRDRQVVNLLYTFTDKPPFDLDTCTVFRLCSPCMLTLGSAPNDSY